MCIYKLCQLKADGGGICVLTQLLLSARPSILLLLSLLSLLFLLDDLDVIRRGGGQAVRLLLCAKLFALLLLFDDLLPHLVVLCQVLHDAAEQPPATFRPSYNKQQARHMFSNTLTGATFDLSSLSKPDVIRLWSPDGGTRT